MFKRKNSGIRYEFRMNEHVMRDKMSFLFVFDMKNQKINRRRSRAKNYFFSVNCIAAVVSRGSSTRFLNILDIDF